MTEKEKCVCNNCIFPKCPQCNEGYLVPFSFKEDVFEKWKCTKCSHTIRKNQ